MSSSDLADYITSSALDSYLSENLGPYLSENLEISSSTFAAALSAYISDYGGQTIFDAISQYINA